MHLNQDGFSMRTKVKTKQRQKGKAEPGMTLMPIIMSWVGIF